MTLEVELRNYVKRDGTQPLRIRIIINRKPSYYNLEEYVKKNQWDHKKRIVKNHPLENKINSRIKKIENEIRSLFYEKESSSSKTLIEDYKRSQELGNGDLIEFYQEFIDDLELKMSPISSRTYKIYLNNLESFCKGATFKQIDNDFIIRYERFLLKKGQAINTTAGNLSALKNICKKALKRDIINKDPFYKFQIKRENTKKGYLSIDDIHKIEKIEIPREYTMLRAARNMFLFSFYTGGMRYTDVSLLKWTDINEGVLTYTMNKSKRKAGSNREIVLTKKLDNILEEQKVGNKFYVFPILKHHEKLTQNEKLKKITTRNKEISRALKSIRKRAGVEKDFSFHTAKHSFANYALENEIDLRSIQGLLGHTFLSTTEKYLRDFKQQDQVKAMNKMFKDD